jgi:hypothetical protein
LSTISFLEVGVVDVALSLFRSSHQRVSLAFDSNVILNTTVLVYNGPASPATSSLMIINARAGEASVTAFVKDDFANGVLNGVQLRSFHKNQSVIYTPVSFALRGSPARRIYFLTMFAPQIHAGGGMYTQTLTQARETGSYVLELLHSDSVVADKVLIVEAAAPALRFSHIEGSGLGNERLTYGTCEYFGSPGSRFLAAGLLYDLRIQIRDLFNNPYYAGIVAWDDQFAGRVSSTTHVHESSVGVSFTPRMPGQDLPFRLMIDGSPLFATSVSIVPGPITSLTASATIAEGRAGESLDIDLRAFDIDGNLHTCCCQKGDVVIFFAHLRKPVVSIATVASRAYLVDREIIRTTLPIVPGEYALSIQSGGLHSNVSANFSILAGAIDPASSYLRPSRSTKSTDSIDLLLVMVDRFNNTVPSLAAITNITVIPPASVNVSVGTNDVLITAYDFARPGAHLVYVSLDFQPVSTFPFHIDAPAASIAPKVPSASRLVLIVVGACLAGFSGLFVAIAVWWKCRCRY